MDIPDHIDVLGLDYAVRFETLEDADGYCSPQRQLIVLREGMQKDREAQTFLHELVHAILDQLGCADEYEDEHLVQGLAIGLHKALGFG